MQVTFHENALKEYMDWQIQDCQKLKNINELLNDK